MRDSIFYAAFRSLFTALFGVIGIGLGLILILLLIGSVSMSDTKIDSKLKTTNVEEILPNAEGKRQQLSKEAPVILQIDIDGIIGTEDLDRHTIRKQLVESREGSFKNNRVKAILLHINTPGGTVVDADGIYRALKEYKERYKVPVYAYVDGLCASGGLYVAAAADKIYASDVSLIGSVGVLAPTFANLSKMLEKIGIETLTLTAGKDKDAMNPFRPWKPGEEQNYQDLIDYYYRHFVNIMVNNRPINKEELIKDYGAQVFTAPEAVNRGFIDVSDISLGETIKQINKEIGIDSDYYQVVKLKQKDWWSRLFSENSLLRTGKIQHDVTFMPEMDLALRGQFLYLYRP